MCEYCATPVSHIFSAFSPCLRRHNPLSGGLIPYVAAVSIIIAICAKMHQFHIIHKLSTSVDNSRIPSTCHNPIPDAFRAWKKAVIPHRRRTSLIRLQVRQRRMDSMRPGIYLCIFALLTCFCGRHFMSSIQRPFTPSEGMRQSPLGDRATEPTFTPSGMQERLNWLEKNLL